MVFIIYIPRFLHPLGFLWHSEAVLYCEAIHFDNQIIWPIFLGHKA